jgi:hypothetical protein
MHFINKKVIYYYHSFKLFVLLNFFIELFKNIKFLLNIWL